MFEIYNYPVNYSIPRVAFSGKPNVKTVTKPIWRDEFYKGPLIDKYFDKTALLYEAQYNSRIQELLGKYNIPLKINEKAIADLTKEDGHLKCTGELVVRMFELIPKEMKRTFNLRQLEDAALLHDIGKVLIPEEILNKKGPLTPYEREIMDLHAPIGRELLKHRGFDLRTLDLIENHHQNMPKTSSFAADKGCKKDIAVQILSVADRFCALTENRCYRKKALGIDEALDILKEDKNIEPEVYNALEKIVRHNESKDYNPLKQDRPITYSIWKH